MDFTSLTVFLQAAVIGVLIAAPVGPIGLLTMQRTLERGLAAGLATGLGAAAADAVYGAVGAFSVRWLIDGLTQAKTPLALGGGALLLVLAWRTWHAPAAHTTAPARDARGLLGLAAGTFALTLPVKFRLFIDTLAEQFRFFLVPVFKGIDWGDMPKCALRDVVVVSLPVVVQG